MSAPFCPPTAPAFTLGSTPAPAERKAPNPFESLRFRKGVDPAARLAARREAAAHVRALAKEAALAELRGTAPPTQPKPKPGSKLRAELVAQEDVELPLAKIDTPPVVRIPGAAPFSYCALKTKSKLSPGLGPARGSTWLWFLVADLTVEKCKGGMSARIAGHKFQAGWVKAPEGAVDAKDTRPRQQAMLECVGSGKRNAYGLGRRGVPAGFSHQWDYSDSEWAVGGNGSGTHWAATACRWAETKHEDRWHVEVSMQWATDAAAEGRYVLVAEQRAEKLNRNQYATAMRGAMMYVTGDAERAAAIERAAVVYGKAAASAAR